MVRLGPYKQVFEAHRGSFHKAGYCDGDASALTQAAVAKPLEETASARPAHCFAPAMQHAKGLLEFDQHEDRYCQVSANWKTWATGKVNDEGSWLLRTQHFHRGKFQVGSLWAITLKAACRRVRVTIALM